MDLPKKLLIIAAFFLLARPAAAEDNVCSASYLTDQFRGEDKMDQFGANMQTVNLFDYHINGDCRIVATSPWVEQEALKLNADPKRLILVDLVNQIELTTGPCRNLSPGQVLQNKLSDPVQRAELVRTMVGLSALAQGVEIDFEHLLPETGPLYTQFVKELRAALPSGKKFGAVIQPKTGGITEQGGPIDWRAIEPSLDYMRIMAYYYSWNTSPPGPNITYEKLSQLADYIQSGPQSIPANKARIMLSLYGWDWPISPAGEGQLITFDQAMAIAQANHVTPQRDPAEDTLHFQYRDSGGVLHEIWIEDAVGDQKRVQLLLDKNFPAIDIWHLNIGDPNFWSSFVPHIRTDCPNLAGRPPSPASVVLDHLSAPTARPDTSDALVTVFGSHLGSSDVVFFNGNPLIPSNRQPNSYQVTIPRAELLNVGVFPIQVAQNGGLSNTLNFYVVGNPAITSFDPPSAPAGAPSLTLTVAGNGFEPGSVVLWEGATLPTTFVSTGVLHADVSGSLLAQSGMFHVTVLNRTSGARSSDPYSVGGPPIPIGNEASFGSTVVGPNPWKAGRNVGGVHFFGVQAESEVKLFTVAGQFVRRIQAIGNQAEWDLTNDSGENVASGLYFYLSTGVDGAHRQGTVAVIR